VNIFWRTKNPALKALFDCQKRKHLNAYPIITDKERQNKQNLHVF
jgi:hypothetical protein